MVVDIHFHFPSTPFPRLLPQDSIARFDVKQCPEAARQLPRKDSQLEAKVDPRLAKLDTVASSRPPLNPLSKLSSRPSSVPTFATPKRNTP